MEKKANLKNELGLTKHFGGSIVFLNTHQLAFEPPFLGTKPTKVCEPQLSP